MLSDEEFTIDNSSDYDEYYESGQVMRYKSGFMTQEQALVVAKLQAKEYTQQLDKKQGADLNL